MTEELVDKLLETLHPALAINTTQLCISTRGNTPIQPEICLGVWIEISGWCKVYRVSKYIWTFNILLSKRVANTFLNAVNTCLDLEIKIPDSVKDLNQLAKDRNQISTCFHLFKGVVGAIDGMLVCITKPQPQPDICVTDYFSGHYFRYGLNVQAVCNSNL